MSAPAATAAGWPLRHLLGNKAQLVRSHQRRALRHRLGGDEPTASAVERSAVAAFGFYARYWLESFRLPKMTPAQLDAGISVPNYSAIAQARAGGRGVILAMPHLGGWEWAGFWAAAYLQVPITVVVEPLDPPELFEWFAGFRRDLGMNVVALGPHAGREVAAALANNHIVCLLSDRDLAGDGVEVSFLGDRTTLPAGPALLGLRTGAPVLPTAVYFTTPGSHFGVVGQPLPLERKGKLRADVARVTQLLADELGHLIALDPPQWHMFSPNWPGDR